MPEVTRTAKTIPEFLEASSLIGKLQVWTKTTCLQNIRTTQVDVGDL